MTTVSVHEAKTHLSRLIEQVLAGEEVVIARNKEPVVRIVREGMALPRKTSRIGTMAGRISVGDEAGGSFLPDEYLGLSIFDNDR